MIKKSVVCLVFALTGCAGNQYNAPTTSADIESRDVGINVHSPQTNDNLSDTSTPLKQNFNQQRAQHFESLNASSPTQKIDAILSSAEYYIQAQNYQSANTNIEQLNAVRLSQQQANRLSIIKAYIDYAQADYRVSLNRLNRLLENSDQTTSSSTEPLTTKPLDQLAPQQRIDALLLSSFNHQALEDNAAAIQALITREQYLTGNARAENSRYTWQLIRALDDAQRAQILTTTQIPALRNRLEQSNYENYNPVNAQPSQFGQWRDDSDQSTQDIDNQWTAQSPQRIAILLPLNSRFNKAAEAVSDGIQYQHSLNDSVYKPQISVYDIGNDPLQIQRYYSSAQNNGADLIIGPLGVDFANQLNYSLIQSNPSPTILLGGNTPLSNPNTVRLALNPEQEGINVAKKAFSDGHINAALLIPNNKTSERIANAFQQYWLNQGGKISNVVWYSDTQFDHSTEIKQLFDINSSRQRFKKLATTLGFKPKFSAYRRQDIDFIFMLANNQTGRIVRPQINFFQSRNIPVLTTSSIYNGVPDETNNMDLENTHFPTLPWVFESSQVSQYAGQLNNLFALGIDAYQIAASFSQLRNNPTLSIKGKTGQLNIDQSGNVNQRPIWANFQKGLAVTSAPYIPLIKPEDQNNHTSSGLLNKPHGSNTYDESNWDAGQSRRKTGVAIPQTTRNEKNNHQLPLPLR